MTLDDRDRLIAEARTQIEGMLTRAAAGQPCSGSRAEVHGSGQPRADAAPGPDCAQLKERCRSGRCRRGHIWSHDRFAVRSRCHARSWPRCSLAACGSLAMPRGSSRRPGPRSRRRGRRASRRAQQGQDQPPMFRTEANFVRVDVYPTAGGKPVTDLKQDDFEVLEDGVPQKVADLRARGVQAPTVLDRRAAPRAEHRGAVARDGGRPEGASLRPLPRHLSHLRATGAMNVRGPRPVPRPRARSGRPRRRR